MLNYQRVYHGTYNQQNEKNNCFMIYLIGDFRNGFQSPHWWKDDKPWTGNLHSPIFRDVWMFKCCSFWHFSDGTRSNTFQVQRIEDEGIELMYQQPNAWCSCCLSSFSTTVANVNFPRCMLWYSVAKEMLNYYCNLTISNWARKVNGTNT